jgi:hypothetical protein
MSAGYDIIIEQGSTFTFNVTVDGLNITAYTIRMKGRSSHAASGTIFSVDTTSGITAALVGSDTVVSIVLGSNTTAALTAPSYGVYDLEYSDDGGAGDPIVTRILEGTFYVTPEATR